MDNHRSRCELEPVECPFCEAGCKVNVVRKEFDSHMSRNQQNHLLVLLGAFQETKRELHITQSKLLQLEASQYRQITLKQDGDEVTFYMYNYSLYKHTGKVWHSPPFYFGDGYKLCLAVYANGKGAGAGTHVSVELLQMKGEHDDKLRWNKRAQYQYPPYSISIQMIAQSEKEQVPQKEVSLHICTKCFVRQPPPEDLHVFKNGNGNAVSGDKFIDHQSAEQVMVSNDAIALRVSLYQRVPKERWHD